MTIIYNLVASYEKGRNGVLLSEEKNFEGDDLKKIEKDFNFWFEFNFFEKIVKKANNFYSNVEINDKLQLITIEISSDYYDDNGNYIDDRSMISNRYYFYHPLIGLLTSKREAEEELQKIKEEDEREGF